MKPRMQIGIGIATVLVVMLIAGAYMELSTIQPQTYSYSVINKWRTEAKYMYSSNGSDRTDTTTTRLDWSNNADATGCNIVGTRVDYSFISVCDVIFDVYSYSASLVFKTSQIPTLPSGATNPALTKVTINIATATTSRPAMWDDKFQLSIIEGWVPWAELWSQQFTYPAEGGFSAEIPASVLALMWGRKDVTIIISPCWDGAIDITRRSWGWFDSSQASEIKIDPQNSSLDIEYNILTPSTYKVSGVVKDGSTSSVLAGVSVTVTDSDGNAKTATTNSSGYYELYPYTDGSYSIQMSHSGYDTLNATFTISGQNYLYNANLTPTSAVQKYSLTVYVWDNNNNPISGASVTLSGVGSTSTDVNGTAPFSNLRVGTYGLTVIKGTLNYTQDVGIPATNDRVDVILTSTYIPPNPPTDTVKLSGFVTDTSGNPVEGMTVMISYQGHTTTTNSGGYFSFDVPKTQSYYLYFSRDGYESTSITVSVGTVDFNTSAIKVAKLSIIPGIPDIVVYGAIIVIIVLLLGGVIFFRALTVRR